MPLHTSLPSGIKNRPYSSAKIIPLNLYLTQKAMKHRKISDWLIMAKIQSNNWRQSCMIGRANLFKIGD